MRPDLRLIDPRVALIVDGVLSDSDSEKTSAVISPSNARHSLALSAGGDPDVDREGAAARKAFDDGQWSAAPPFRRRTLRDWVDLIEAEKNDLDAPCRQSGFGVVGGLGNMESYVRHHLVHSRLRATSKQRIRGVAIQTKPAK